MTGKRPMDGTGRSADERARADASRDATQTRRELLAQLRALRAGTTVVPDAGQIRRLAALLNDQSLSRRQLLQIVTASGALLFIDSGWPLGGIARAAEALQAPPAHPRLASGTGAPGQAEATGRAAEEITVQQLAPSFVASVLRRDDMLALRFEFFNLELQGTSIVRQVPSRPAYIVAQFAHGTDVAPQSLAEEAFLETAPNIVAPDAQAGEALKPPGTLGASLAGPSRLAFKLPDGLNAIPYTLTELMAWASYEQSVAAQALPPPAPSLFALLPGIVTAAGRDPITIEPAPVVAVPPSIQEPAPTETAIEAPWQVILSPSQLGGWAHAAAPVTHGGRTELWHTRLGVRGQLQNSPGVYGVDEGAAFYRTVRAIWTPGFDREAPPDPNFQGSFRSSLTANDRWQLVRLTSDFLIPLFTPSAVEVDRLMLTAMGAWLDVRGDWPLLPAPAEGLDISEWRHLSTMGRDHYVRIVKEGFLFPLGHAATLVKITERKFQTVTGGALSGQRAAYLRQRFFIVVRQAEKTYPGVAQPNDARGWPFQRVRITTLVTPSLDDPKATPLSAGGQDAGQEAFWPQLSGSNFQFHVVAEDGDGQESEFTLPLAFVVRGKADDLSFMDPAVADYTSDSPPAATVQRRTRPFDGQRVALAPSDDPGDTTLEVRSLSLGAALPEPGNVTLPADQPRFYPVWIEAEVRHPGMEQVKGALDPLVIEPHPQWLTNGFGGANAAALFVQLKSTVDLNFTGAGSSDKAGGLVTPNIAIRALSRSLGPVGGLLDTLPTEFDPAQFFSDAKILGGLLLSDVVETALGFATAPGITHRVIYPDGDRSKLPQAVETRLTWQPELKQDPLQVFQPGPGGSMVIDGTFRTPLDPPGEPTFELLGDLREFDISLVGDGDLKFLVIKFNKLVFTAQTGAKINIDPDIREVEFAGVLSFVNTLRQYLSSSNPAPSVDVTPTGVTAGYSLAIPTIGVGVLTLQNISLGALLNLPFTGAPARVRFHFSERENPFLLTVYGIGGGGYFSIDLGLDGVEGMEAKFEFGASVALSIAVAAGEVHLMAGIYYKAEQVFEQGKEVEKASLTAYMRMGGSLSVLGLVTISVEFYLALEYESQSNQLWGQAKLTVEIEVLFFSFPLEMSVERQLAGPSNNGQGALQVAQGGASQRFVDLVSVTNWLDYADAFAPQAGGGASVSTRTLTLQAGWNLVGWIGAETPIEEAMAPISGGFDKVFTFDPTSNDPSTQFKRYDENAPAFLNTLTSLKRGDGVWLFVAQAITWTQPVEDEALTVALGAGFNMVAWGGPDGLPASQALAGIAADLQTAFTFDAATQQFRSYAPILPSSLALGEGDGVFLNMTGAAIWQQPSP